MKKKTLRIIQIEAREDSKQQVPENIFKINEHGIPTIQLMEHMKFKRKKDQGVDASVLLRRGNKIIKGSRGWERLGRKRRGGGEEEGEIRDGR